jgi:hypothetical protein
MRLIFISLILLFISGCTETPDVSPSKEVIAKDQIQSNKTEAQKAKEEYSDLQKKRHYD